MRLSRSRAGKHHNVTGRAGLHDLLKAIVTLFRQVRACMRGAHRGFGWLVWERNRIFWKHRVDQTVQNPRFEFQNCVVSALGVWWYTDPLCGCEEATFWPFLCSGSHEGPFLNFWKNWFPFDQSILWLDLTTFNFDFLMQLGLKVACAKNLPPGWAQYVGKLDANKSPALRGERLLTSPISRRIHFKLYWSLKSKFGSEWIMWNWNKKVSSQTLCAPMHSMRWGSS
jgi:hypothetical protein